MLKARWLALCCVALFGPALAAAPSSLPKAPKAKLTPEGALKGFVKALEAGNITAARAYLAPPLDAAWAKDLEMIQAGISFEEALDQKFGKQAGKTATTWKSIAGQYAATVRSVEMAGKDRARLTLWSTAERPEGKVIYEDTLEATQLGGAWKLHVPLPGTNVGARTRKEMRKGPDGKDVEVRVVVGKPDVLTARQLERLMRITDATCAETARHTEAVRAGKFKTRAEAEASLQAVLDKILS
jgi:hypothetical protein